MMMKYAVIITPQAEGQLFEIRDYIELELFSPKASVNTIKMIESGIISLESFPERVAKTEELRWKEMGVRKLSVGNYYVYFVIDEFENKVYVIAIVYSKRDQSNIVFSDC